MCYFTLSFQIHSAVVDGELQSAEQKASVTQSTRENELLKVELSLVTADIQGKSAPGTAGWKPSHPTLTPDEDTTPRDVSRFHVKGEGLTAQRGAKSLNVCAAPVKPGTGIKPPATTATSDPVPAAPRGSQAAPAKVALVGGTQYFFPNSLSICSLFSAGEGTKTKSTHLAGLVWLPMDLELGVTSTTAGTCITLTHLAPSHHPHPASLRAPRPAL
ncbi:unnamed protein product [Pleuronectes platessa]|uniref:Uncharacterized protein n=1 Tax=Pleuronectes platessa TaxID=8262 RepID=A0A9N7Z3B0_PLEPL|nr:unnamed protein product [Pleuronectes platessa]